MIKYKQYFQKFITYNIEKIHDFICNFCDPSFTNQFFFYAEK